jgi:membrane fusion protein (multidrug efflux system)
MPVRVPSPRSLFVIVAAALCAATLAGCGKGGDAKAASAATAPPAVPVTVLRAASQKVPVSLEAVGQAEGSREVEIRARVTGIIEKRLYEEGAPVTAGATLFLIDPVPYELAAQQAQAALVQEKVRKELAEMEAQRLKPLAEEKAIPQREVDQALATARTATAAIASAEAKLKEAQLNLSYTRVTAPISGVTGRAQRSEGSLVTANTDSSLLTTMTQVNPIWVRFSLAEADFTGIRGAERQARAQIIDNQGKVLADNGRLNFTGSTVDAKLGTVQMRAEFGNTGQRWMPGQFVKVRLLAGEQTAMLVPQTALVQGEQSRLVMTVGPEGKAVPKPVRTANWIGDDAVVISGLAEGDSVIVDNLVKVRPGTAVQPKGAGAPAPAAPAAAAPKK